MDDYTAVWFLQTNGVLVWAIDYYEASGDGAEQIVRACMPEMIPDDDQAVALVREIEPPKPYFYDRHYLPHDVKVRVLFAKRAHDIGDGLLGREVQHAAVDWEKVGAVQHQFQ